MDFKSKNIWIFYKYSTTNGESISLGYKEGNNSTGNVVEVRIENNKVKNSFLMLEGIL